MYKIGEEFNVVKTSDIYVDVSFTYNGSVWNGVLPLYGEKQGYENDLREIRENIEDYYNKLEPSERIKWSQKEKVKWRNQTDKTYEVFESLFSGEWECKACGPVSKVNNQSSARIKAIKLKGYFVATKTRYCQNCEKKTYHDILVMADINKEQNNSNLRNAIPKKLNDRICNLFNQIESVFEKAKTRSELVIDHKFPSQRWIKPESDNTNCMTNSEIREKFQLLDNQTNLLKSKECDKCKFEGKRGVFMGIQWYYKGNENWKGKSLDDEAGCIGCPWYDVLKWKEELKKKLKEED